MGKKTRRMFPKRKKELRTPQAQAKCRDCGKERTAYRHEFFKAARPKCYACGGLLEYQGTWHGVPSDTGRRS